MRHEKSQIIAGADWDAVEEDFAPLIEPGDYEAHCVEYKEFRQFGNQPKLCLTWSFALSCKEGLFLPQYFNMAHKKFKESSYYYQAWFMANGYKRPLRRTRRYMPPKIFKGIMATVRVETVRRKFPDGSYRPEKFDYSKVSFIREVLHNSNHEIAEEIDSIIVREGQ